MKKRLLTILIIAAMSASFTGCGGNDSEKTSESAQTTAATEAVEDSAADDEIIDEDTADDEITDENTADDELDAALQELANALDGTLWVGMDPEYSCYALGFSGEYAVLVADDGSSVEGYWGVDDTTLYLFEDEAWEIELAQIPWDYDMETETLILNETAVMAQTDEYSFEDAAVAMEQMALACQVAELLTETYWVAIEDEQAEAMYLSGSTIEIISVMSDGTAGTIEAYWGLDYDCLYLYDESYNVIAAQVWQIAEDGSELYLTDEEGITTTYVQCTEEEAADIMTYLMESVGIAVE